MSKVKASLFNILNATSKGKCKTQSPTKLHKPRNKQSLSFPLGESMSGRHLRHYGDPTGE